MSCGCVESLMGEPESSPTQPQNRQMGKTDRTQKGGAEGNTRENENSHFNDSYGQDSAVHLKDKGHSYGHNGHLVRMVSAHHPFDLGP